MSGQGDRQDVGRADLDMDVDRSADREVAAWTRQGPFAPEPLWAYYEVMIGPAGVYRFESFSDVDLFNLAEIARTEDYPRLAQWILSHKDRELIARSDQHLKRRRSEYDELKEKLLRALHRFTGHNPLGFKRCIKDISDINTVADRMLETLLSIGL